MNSINKGISAKEMRRQLINNQNYFEIGTHHHFKCKERPT